MLFEEQIIYKKKYGHFELDKCMPPVTGTLRWTYNLRERVMQPIKNFKALQHPYIN